MIRYVEQNPLRAKLTTRAEEWQWSSLYRRLRNNKEDQKLLAVLPTDLPSNYLEEMGSEMGSLTPFLPNDVAYVAYSTAKRSLPPYLYLKSPKKFTQHQLVACLVLKEFFTTDYRGIEAIINDSSELKI